MSDLPASHYLQIYEHRVSLSERGITDPTPQVVAGMKRLVAALRALKPEEEVAVDASNERFIFKKSATGELLAQIDLDALKA